MTRTGHSGIQGVMHGNEPLKKLPNTQIKMEQQRHSLAPHWDSFTKSTPSLSPPKPHQNVLKTAASSLSLGCACPPALACQGHSGPGEGAVCGLLGIEQGWRSHCWSVVRLQSLTSIHLSIHLSIYLVSSLTVGPVGGTSISLRWRIMETWTHQI